jgi:hypothetical protein
MGGEVTAGTQYLDSVGSERLEVLAAGDQVYIDTRPTEARSYIRTDRTGTQHSNLHVELPSSAMCIQYAVWNCDVKTAQDGHTGVTRADGKPALDIRRS